MEQDDFGFILNQAPQKQTLLGGTSKKKRLIFMAIGAALLLVGIIIIASVIMGNGNNTATLLAPVSAAQTDIIEITELGAKDARDTVLINKTASTNLVLTTQNSAINGKLGKDAKKMIAPYQNSEYKKELEDAKNAGNFDSTYAAILSNRLDLYRQTLVTAYSQAPTTKLKKELESYYAQVGILIGEQTTPS
jgi:hypothetical protein